jgi:SAM-dependent methyltransferase
MTQPEYVARQRAFWDAGEHPHLRVQDGDRYAAHIAAALAAQAGLRPHHRVLELGAGFGRFTFPLLEHCGAVLAVDLAERALRDLDRARAARGIAAERCRTLCREADAVVAADCDGPIDFVVGFFFLHHLADYRATIARLAPLAAAGVAFVEPNRRNPLYLAQILCCPDMHWHEERGLYRIGERHLRGTLHAAGLVDVRSRTFGFFPPQVVNRSPTAERLERRLEAVAVLRPVLPFVLASGCWRAAAPA